nr:MAG TPA: hypothetical protein [Caudoviricetes sp.]
MKEDPRIEVHEVVAPVTKEDFTQALARCGMTVLGKVERGEATSDEFGLVYDLMQCLPSLLSNRRACNALDTGRRSM